MQEKYSPADVERFGSQVPRQSVELYAQQGAMLYVGNRGHESLAIFEIDPTSGRLTASSAATS